VQYAAGLGGSYEVAPSAPGMDLLHWQAAASGHLHVSSRVLVARIHVLVCVACHVQVQQLPPAVLLPAHAVQAGDWSCSGPCIVSTVLSTAAGGY
jgi:hypothetical protein